MHCRPAAQGSKAHCLEIAVQLCAELGSSLVASAPYHTHRQILTTSHISAASPPPNPPTGFALQLERLFTPNLTFAPRSRPRSFSRHLHNLCTLQA